MSGGNEVSLMFLDKSQGRCLMRSTLVINILELYKKQRNQSPKINLLFPIDCRYLYRKTTKKKFKSTVQSYFFQIILLFEKQSNYLFIFIVKEPLVTFKSQLFLQIPNPRNQFYIFLIELSRMKRRNILQKEGPNLEQTELYDKITKIEVQILDKIQKLKINSKNTVCQHFNINSPQCQEYDNRVNYYDKFWKRFLLNQIGKQNLLQFREQVEIFSKRIEKIDSLFQEWEKIVEPVSKPKKKSSKSEDNQREICPYCQRAYKDEETLMIHIKVKHSQMITRNRRDEQDIYESEQI